MKKRKKFDIINKIVYFTYEKKQILEKIENFLFFNEKI